MHAEIFMGEMPRDLGFALKFFSEERERKEWREGGRQSPRQSHHVI